MRSIKKESSVTITIRQSGDLLGARTILYDTTKEEVGSMIENAVIANAGSPPTWTQVKLQGKKKKTVPA